MMIQNNTEIGIEMLFGAKIMQAKQFLKFCKMKAYGVGGHLTPVWKNLKIHYFFLINRESVIFLINCVKIVGGT